VTTRRKIRDWPWLLMALVVTIAFLSGCGDADAKDCASCPNQAMKPACEEAAVQCDQVPADMTQTCIDEALALCA